jgi:small subunit ribosomal protein S21
MKDYKKNKKNFKKAVKGGESESQVVTTTKTGPSDPVLVKPLEVVVYNNNVEKALRAFRALVQKERILSLYKEKQSYEKPSDKRRRKRNEMKRKRHELENFKNSDSKGLKKPFKKRFPKETSPE